jgi:hypothetical protein
MYTRSDQNLSDTYSHIAESTVKINKLKSEVMWAICAIFTVALLMMPLIWIDSVQTHALNHTFISTSSNILKAYVRFDGQQILIINKNQFDWTDIRIEVSSNISKDHHLNGTIGTSGFILMAPRINSGEAYPVELMQFRREDGAKLDPVAARPETIRIWSDTPRGRGFWYGGFVQPPAVADWPFPPAELRSGLRVYVSTQE